MLSRGGRRLWISWAHSWSRCWPDLDLMGGSRSGHHASDIYVPAVPERI